MVGFMNKSIRFGSVRLPRWCLQVGGVAMVGLVSFACSSDADVPSAQGGAAGGGGKAGNAAGGKAGSAGGGNAGQSSSQGGGGQTNGGTGNVGNGGASGHGSPSAGSGGSSGSAGGLSGGSGGTSGSAGGLSGGSGGTSSTAGGPSGGSGGDNSSTAGGPSGGGGNSGTAGGPSGGGGNSSTAGGPSGGSGGTSGSAGGPSGGSGGTAQAGSGGAQGGSGGAQGGSGGSGGGCTQGSGGAAPTTYLKWLNGYIDGASNTGSVQGYWYTFTGGASSVISEAPAFGVACSNICVNGSAAQQAGGSGCFLGFNTNQVAGTGTASNGWNATSKGVTGVEFVLTGSQVPATIQIDVKVKGSANNYCLVRSGVISGGAQNIPFAALQQDCRTIGGSHPAPDATKIEAIHLQIPTSASSSTGFNFCVTSIKLL